MSEINRGRVVFLRKLIVDTWKRQGKSTGMALAYRPPDVFFDERNAIMRFDMVRDPVFDIAIGDKVRIDLSFTGWYFMGNSLGWTRFTTYESIALVNSCEVAGFATLEGTLRGRWGVIRETFCLLAVSSRAGSYPAWKEHIRDGDLVIVQGQSVLVIPKIRLFWPGCLIRV